MIITKNSIPAANRPAWPRNAAVALPLLDSMVPAFAAAQARAVLTAGPEAGCRLRAERHGDEERGRRRPKGADFEITRILQADGGVSRPDAGVDRPQWRGEQRRRCPRERVDPVPDGGHPGAHRIRTCKAETSRRPDRRP